VNGILLDAQLAWLLKRLSIHNPAAWITIPTAVGAIRRRQWAHVVFNRSDDFAMFPEVDHSLIRRLEQEILATADDVVYVNRRLYAQEKHLVHRASYIAHGVDYDHFASARSAAEPARPPKELGSVNRPIIGFYGALDDYTIDLELLIKIARTYHQATVLIIGPKQMDIAALEAEPNVQYVGPMQYAALPRYAACFDVALMPWLRNGWISACNPIKLKEYLALGFPVVTTRFDELQPYKGLVYPADTHDEFLSQIANALREQGEDLVHQRRRAVIQDSWDRVACKAAELFDVRGIGSTRK
jgi:glycosyltransferase involved in cell wall biosynthesis